MEENGGHSWAVTAQRKCQRASKTKKLAVKPAWNEIRKHAEQGFHHSQKILQEGRKQKNTLGCPRVELKIWTRKNHRWRWGTTIFGKSQLLPTHLKSSKQSVCAPIKHPVLLKDYVILAQRTFLFCSWDYLSNNKYILCQNCNTRFYLQQSTTTNLMKGERKYVSLIPIGKF